MVNYLNQTVELTIRENGQKIDSFKWDCSEKDIERKIFFILRDKYGIFRKKERDHDLDWLSHV